ncbi:MAG: T9SS type A sorting domain-containing protein [Bacteroidales bacterium]|nr:T9SS type A sorting domain-containing protein [Bacteroidales bacterium]
MLFPNPAGNYFIAQYDLVGQTSSGILKICDLNGKELRAIRLKDKKNQVVIPTHEYSNGVYLIRLSVGNYLMDSQKLTIVR